MCIRPDLIHIGTSGWSYGHWRGSFYPGSLPARNWLPFYAERFHTVEINNSFYRLPREKTLEQWRDTVPQGFLFSVKASRFITHMKKLRDCEEPLQRFLDQIASLGEKLGPVLFQLPPRWKTNPERLIAFLHLLPNGLQVAFEFRDITWFHPEIYGALRSYGAAFCIYELAGLASPVEVTADFVYIRLHGPGGAYQGQYSEESLATWARLIGKWAEEGRRVYCYFDNDQNAYAAHDALRLQAMIPAADRK